MRTKPTAPSGPPNKRRRVSLSPTAAAVYNWRSHSSSVRWAYAEWFISTLDEPYFSHSEFQQAMCSAMGLSSLVRGPATRLQLSRARAAMCNAFGCGHAQPRRLSPAFLAAERQELEIYRKDARRVLRGKPLSENSLLDEPDSHVLQPHWWSRYRCPPPLPPERGSAVLVRTTRRPAAPLLVSPQKPASAQSEDVQPSSNKKRKSEDNDKDSTEALLCTPRRRQRSVDGGEQDRSIEDGSFTPPLMQKGTEQKENEAEVPIIREAVFICLEEEDKIRVRFLDEHDDSSEHLVSDMDVMQNTVSSLIPESLLNASPSSLLLPQEVGHLSPAFGRYSFSPSPIQEPFHFDFSRFDAPPSLVQLFQSPKPMVVSPQRSLSVKSRTRDQVECEVDVQQLAESLRLLDRKQQILMNLRNLNEAVDSGTAVKDEPHELTAGRYNAVFRELEEVNAELGLVMHPNRKSSPPPSSDLSWLQSVPLNMDMPRFGDASPYSKFGTPLINKPSGAIPSPEIRAMRHAGTHPISLPEPSPAQQVRQVQGQSDLIHYEQERDQNENQYMETHGFDTSGSHDQHFANSGELTAVKKALSAKHVDFRNASGATILAKALTRAALANLSEDSKLRTAPTSIRADVMECVSSCVSVLVRARATRDYRSIEELVDGIRVRHPENREAIEAIHEAAKRFETPSSDSLSG